MALSATVPRPPAPDQAATLRRLFAARPVRVLPLLCSHAREPAMAAWLAKLALGMARQGDRTLVVDAARIQVAAALGLRARYDLQHALDGDCSPRDAVLDAAPGLFLLPAARAFDALSRPSALAADRYALRAALLRHAQVLGCDLVFLLIGPLQAAVLTAEGECVLPVLDSIATAPADAASALPPAAASALRAALQALRRADIARFRLLFLGMDQPTATTLAARMGTAAGSLRGRLHQGGHALMPRDLAAVVRATAGWHCAAWASPPPEFLV